VVFEEKLLNAWVGGDQTWVFEKGSDPNSYELTFTDETAKGSFIVHLVKLENKLFFDIFLDKYPCEQQDLSDMKWGYNTFLFLPAHTFIAIDSIGPQLKMRMTDDDNIKKLLAEDPNAVKHEVIESSDHRIVLTASTAELQKFVLKYADDDRLFPKNRLITLTKYDKKNDPNNNEPNDIKKP
jgi:hypothetical protein